MVSHTVDECDTHKEFCTQHQAYVHDPDQPPMYRAMQTFTVVWPKGKPSEEKSR